MTEESPAKKGIQAEMLVGLSAVFIGICALAVSLYEAKLMREEQRSSVLPIVELGRSYFTRGEMGADNEWRLLLHAENVGIGPAVIADFRVTVDGEPHPTWRSAMQALVGANVPVEYSQSTITGRTIPPERSITMFDLANSQIAGDIIAEMGRLNFEACYCSVFDECWTSDYAGGFASGTPAPSCKRDENSFQE